MQFLEKIKQTVENGNFRSNFGPKNIFREFDLY